MKIAIYPGSFDPFTNGHLDILERATKIFDRVIVAIGHNRAKQATIPLGKRQEMLNEIVKDFNNVDVVTFDQLTVELAASLGAVAIIRGLRALNDFEYEFQMALMNEQLDAKIETVFLMARKENTFISSSLIKELARYGKKLDDFVPQVVADYYRGQNE